MDIPPLFMDTPPLFKAQQDFVDFCLSFPQAKGVPTRVLNTSDPGTGKTRAVLEAWYRAPGRERLVVAAPLSILAPAWRNDAFKYFPRDLGVTIAHGSPDKRLAAFRSSAQIVLINHDGIKWLAEHSHLLGAFSHMAVDEFSAFKHGTTQRGKALEFVTRFVPNVIMMGGTPNSNEVTDIWHPVFCLDRGERLGNSFFRFRNQVADSRQVGPKPNMIKWVERHGARDWIADQLKDITFRVTLEECLDMPEHVVSTMFVDMPKPVMQAYEQMQRYSLAEFDEGAITAVHAGARAKKLLQILSGAVYKPGGEIQKVFTDRYELVADLVHERDLPCVVAFNWKHERDGIADALRARGMPYAVIDGEVPPAQRDQITDDFQAGRYKALIAHPQSAAHGFTWTAATTTIWCSPTYNAEHYQQFNRRIYRAGQKLRTETIRIAASNTCEEAVYDKLDQKMDSMQDLLSMMCRITQQREVI